MMARVEEQLPSEWSVDSLGSLVESVRASARILPGEIYELWSVPSFSTGMPEVVTGESIGSGKLEIRPDDVLISKINPRINRVWLVSRSEGSRPKIGSTEWLVARIRPGVELLPSYLALYMKSPTVRESIKGMTQGVTGSHTRAKANQILTIPVPLPSTREQTRIVEILEEQLSRLDAAVQSVQTVREKATQFRRSLLRATLHGRAVSENWAWHCLGEVSQMSLGKMLDRKHETGRFATKYLRNINVRWGQFDLRDLAQMDIAPHELERVSLRSGDVVVCEGGEPGRAAVWSLDEPIAIQKALHRVRPSRDLSSRFLAYVFETEFRGSSEHALFTGTTIAHLPKEKLRNLKIPFPSFQKQEEVADFLDEQVSWLNSALVAADEVERKTNVLRRSLLHAAFTGELTRSWREANV